MIKNLYSKAAAFLGGFFMRDDVLHFFLYLAATKIIYLIIVFIPPSLAAPLIAILTVGYGREVTQEQCKKFSCDFKKGWNPKGWRDGFKGGKWKELFNPAIATLVYWAVFLGILYVGP